ncbi:MAG: tRNA (N6-threonylcarbamoyladenosine(37)-N6)-methyltransferase TrmO [Dehalococcoidales bacterium]|nr:tRNA (N6-threonylcarbamoyladenosine(37)-N6)-methyltransferase TrmO [Dehalococcoidales bacterium]
MNCTPIGTVVSPVKEGVDNGWGKVISEIRLEKDLAPGLTGLDSFSHIIIVFEMHKSTWDSGSDLVRHPQGRDDMPFTGIFAQRAKHRPNPIGITAVRLLSVEENVLRVQGLDAIDGTPILDIKPYYPKFDRVDTPGVPEWVDRLMTDYF